jgi:hypothetical protein
MLRHFNARNERNLLRSYLVYYNSARIRLLAQAPIPETSKCSAPGRIVAPPIRWRALHAGINASAASSNFERAIDDAFIATRVKALADRHPSSRLKHIA